MTELSKRSPVLSVLGSFLPLPAAVGFLAAWWAIAGQRDYHLGRYGTIFVIVVIFAGTLAAAGLIALTFARRLGLALAWVAAAVPWATGLLLTQRFVSNMLDGLGKVTESDRVVLLVEGVYDALGSAIVGARASAVLAASVALGLAIVSAWRRSGPVAHAGRWVVALVAFAVGAASGGQLGHHHAKAALLFRGVSPGANLEWLIEEQLAFAQPYGLITVLLACAAVLVAIVGAVFAFQPERRRAGYALAGVGLLAAALFVGERAMTADAGEWLLAAKDGKVELAPTTAERIE